MSERATIGLQRTVTSAPQRAPIGLWAEGMALCDLGARARLMRHGRGRPRDRYRPMRWVYNKRLGSWLALAALALQLVVSFGHVHLDGVHRTYAAPAVSGLAAEASQLPAPQPGNDADHDYCAICATIFLAANSFLPPAPQLPVPSVSQTVERFARVPVVFIASRRAPFQSRAPPLA